MFRFYPALMSVIIVFCFSLDAIADEVNIYSARKENLIKPLLDKFSAESGIKTNLITAKADKLLTRMVNEGRNTPADILITTDAGRLFRAKQAGILQDIESPAIEKLVPPHLRDVDDQWVGLSLRSRVIFYARERVAAEQLSSYEDLADPRWKKRICIRGSGNIYNQSMVASMIAARGEQATQVWASGLVANLARKPKGGDRDQIKAAAAGQCDIAIANTYYYGKMLDSQNDPSQMAAAKKMAVFWPNQNDRGAHVNVSGVGISKYSKNKQSALRLIEFLLSTESQNWYASVNYEYPVVAGVAPSKLVASWGRFKSDVVNLSRLGELNATAVKIMDRAGWR
ncbi:MAG: Fe(3+) ABC transporter substrate-binding protein [Gammaproteobacteria bacterium]|nr:Fe(3+) ABC transporter substrate-binding protein [Gammaproteobacteria bacterium]